jgi:hypothetical protein
VAIASAKHLQKVQEQLQFQTAALPGLEGSVRQLPTILFTVTKLTMGLVVEHFDVIVRDLNHCGAMLVVT